jgi:hypothetical protein
VERDFAHRVDFLFPAAVSDAVKRSRLPLKGEPATIAEAKTPPARGQVYIPSLFIGNATMINRYPPTSWWSWR